MWPPLPFEFAWGDLSQKSRNAIARNFSRHKRRGFELLAVRFAGERTDYGPFTVHRDARLDVRDLESGEELELDLLGSVLEWRGRYKLFSYVTD